MVIILVIIISMEDCAGWKKGTPTVKFSGISRWGNYSRGDLEKGFDRGHYKQVLPSELKLDIKFHDLAR